METKSSTPHSLRRSFFLGYTAVTRDDAPPSIRFRTQAIRAVTGGYLVDLTLRNEGKETAANLKFEERLIKDEQTVETSEATVDYVPSKSERQAGLSLRMIRAVLKLTFQAKGYERP